MPEMTLASPPSRPSRSIRTVAWMLALLALAGCGMSYQPGRDGRSRALPQNAPANSEPQPAGSLPR
ncbi:MAG: hypothetical protein ACRYGM_19175 [Janthinobacterium lividum]